MCEFLLPPYVNVCETQGYFEIEVSRIKVVNEKTLNETNNGIINNRKRNCQKQNTTKKTLFENQAGGQNSVRVKFIWCGEKQENAASVRIERVKEISAQQHILCDKSKSKAKNKQQRQTEQTTSVTEKATATLCCHNNKLRYSIRTNLALFLDYLRSCEPIEIVVLTNNNNNSTSNGSVGTLGQAKLRLPGVLLRKYAANYRTNCNFEHKTKIYALYNCAYQQHQQEQQQKTGEIQLVFRMLFAPNAKHALQEQLTTLQQRLHDTTKDTTTMMRCNDIKATSPVAMQQKQAQTKFANANNAVQYEELADKSARRATKSKEIVNAMKKLDAKLVAYLACEEDMPTKESFKEFEAEENFFPLKDALPLIKKLADEDEAAKLALRTQQLEMFKCMSAIKLHMEALTLEPEGTKTMDLLQNDIRPVITVECQLSHELIKNVPRYDMFHIMQFETDKFQSATQCARFGQQAERDVCLALDEEDVAQDAVAENDKAEKSLNFGRIHFVVWWREPSTCLNEMLGMGVLELEELYKAALLEQCKCIAINRRGKHLASLYFKITLKLQCENNNNESSNGKLSPDQLTAKQCNDGSDSDADDNNSQKKEAPNGAETNAADKPSSTADASKTSSNKNNNIDNDRHDLESCNLTIETTKIRLLKGFVYACETRNLDSPKSDQCYEHFLVCRRFWREEAAATAANDNHVFNYQEQFAVLNDEQFLKRVDKQHLQLELWRRLRPNADNNGNAGQLEPTGIVQLPLHQFYIAYRDVTMANHLCKGKLPVISIDAWTPIKHYQSSVVMGEMKCLLAIGSEEQITNLQVARGFKTFNANVATTSANAANDNAPNLLADDVSAALLNSAALQLQAQTIETAASAALKKTTDLLDMLQQAFVAQPPSAPPPEAAATATTAVAPAKPLQQTNNKCFKFALEIRGATGLPLNAAAKGKKSSKRNASASKRFPPNEAPSTYITFQADDCNCKVYKSHEGNVYATSICEKSTQPQWAYRFRVTVSMDYLTNPLKRFILKIWKKAASHAAEKSVRLQPTPMDDAIIGFAALDLNVFQRGQQIAGAFNIVDFNGRINGQLEVHCQPLESVHQQQALPVTAAADVEAPTVDAVIDQFENSLDLTHLNLGQAIKRKFTELEEISQRLRTRLVDVTGTQLASNFDSSTLDNWQPLDVIANADYDIDDAVLDEFERDINTPPPTMPTTTAATRTTEEVDKLDRPKE